MDVNGRSDNLLREFVHNHRPGVLRTSLSGFDWRRRHAEFAVSSIKKIFFAQRARRLSGEISRLFFLAPFSGRTL